MKLPIVPTRVYYKLFTGGYLAKRRVRIDALTDLVDFLTWEEQRHVIEVNALDDYLHWRVRDVTVKFEKVMLSEELFRNYPFPGVKNVRWPGMYRDYYFYNFVFYSKATLDSIAVLLNDYFKLGFNRGEIDFYQQRFRNKLEFTLNSFTDLTNRYGAWIKRLVSYRTALIHRKSIEIYGNKIPLEPLDDRELSEILEIYRSAPQELKKGVPKRLRLVPVNNFFKETITNIRMIIGLMAKDVLTDLRKRYPNHSFSRKSYG